MALNADRSGGRPRASGPAAGVIDVAMHAPGHVTAVEYAEGIERHLFLRVMSLLEAVVYCERREECSFVSGVE